MSRHLFLTTLEYEEIKRECKWLWIVKCHDTEWDEQE